MHLSQKLVFILKYACTNIYIKYVINEKVFCAVLLFLKFEKFQIIKLHVMRCRQYFQLSSKNPNTYTIFIISKTINISVEIKRFFFHFNVIWTPVQ